VALRYASSNQPTIFGGGRDAPAIWITGNEYWQANFSLDRPLTFAPLRAVVDVAWLNPWTGQWVVHTLPIEYTYFDNTATVQRNVGC
jgi:hypothetical protein